MDKDCPTLIISKPPENGRKMRKINRFDDPFAILSLLQAPFKSPGKEAEFPFIDSQSVKSENRPVHRTCSSHHGLPCTRQRLDCGEFTAALFRNANRLQLFSKLSCNCI